LYFLLDAAYISNYSHLREGKSKGKDKGKNKVAPGA
jgi:hypothetical protein